MTAVLTDDELVAIAVEQDSEWLGNLPTVDATDIAQLASASARGLRSLAVRDLLNGKGSSRLSPEILATVGPAIGKRPTIYAYVAQSAMPLVVTGASIAVFPAASAGESRSTVVITLANGINEIKLFEPALAVTAAKNFMYQVYIEGLGSAADDDAREVVALVFGEKDVEILRVTKGGARRGLVVGDAAESAIADERSVDEFPDGFFVVL